MFQSKKWKIIHENTGNKSLDESGRQPKETAIRRQSKGEQSEGQGSGTPMEWTVTVERQGGISIIEKSEQGL